MWWWFWCCHLSMYIKKIRITSSSSPYVSFFITILYFFIPIYFVTENIYLNNKTNTFDTCCSSTNMSHQLVPTAIILIYIHKRIYIYIDFDLYYICIQTVFYCYFGTARLPDCLLLSPPLKISSSSWSRKV